jgi:hypothetical protein
MGKGTYLGGSTVLTLGENGTAWKSSDPAENESHNARNQRNPRSAGGEEIGTRDKRAIRSFISQCATAHATNDLTARDPVPPKILRNEVNKAGVNIAWLGRTRQRQILFHDAYCRARNEEIPFEKVWKVSST